MFNTTLEVLEEKKAIYTATEIYQQPVVWKELFANLSKQKESLQGFIKEIYSEHESVRVIFTGAGTSAFAGDTIVPELQKQNQINVNFESIATTDIVSNPTSYLKKEIPTIMVSFARSGNSPESIAAVSLGEQIIDNFYQVIITCNKDGALAKNVERSNKALIILTPDKAHDKGFAMTSSFTSMVFAAYFLFTSQPVTDNIANQLAGNGNLLVDSLTEVVNEIVMFDFERIVYLGSGLLGQLSHEAALKMLELSSGKVVATHESSLGFRHGPKSILNEKTVVVLFLSQDSYTRKYDLDILRELAHDNSGTKIVVLTEENDTEVNQLADWTIAVNEGQEKFESDFYLAMLYVTFAQLLALKQSIQLGITPDNPSPDGKVNRVVKGVTIYNYEE